MNTSKAQFFTVVSNKIVAGQARATNFPNFLRCKENDGTFIYSSQKDSENNEMSAN